MLNYSSMHHNIMDVVTASVVPEWHHSTADASTMKQNGSGPCFFFEGPLKRPHVISFYVITACVIVGLVGNSLTVVVFSRPSTRSASSATVYMLALAASDSGYLISILFSRLMTYARCFVVPHLPGIDLYHESALGCKLLQYTLDLFTDTSSCLILAFTIERFIACYRPLCYRKWCTPRVGCVTAAAIFVIVGASTAPYHFMFMLRNESYDVCTVSNDSSEEQIFSFLYITESVIYRTMPVCLIAALNVFIIRKVTLIARQKRARSASSTPRPDALSNEVTSRRPDVTTTWPREETVAGEPAGTGTRRRQEAAAARSSAQLTVMLVLVSMTYIFAFLPRIVAFLINRLARMNLIDLSPESRDLFDVYCQPLYVAAFAINFFLYTMSGSVFRKQLRDIFASLSCCSSSSRCYSGRRRSSVGISRKQTLVETRTEMRSAMDSPQPEYVLLQSRRSSQRLSVPKLVPCNGYGHTHQPLH